MSASLWSRCKGYYQRHAATPLFRKPLPIRPPVPLISFTFDDFPRTAWLTGGAILRPFGIKATYYASLGLTGKQSPSGPIFEPGDLAAILEDGHELGCHTFSHCHSWDTSPAEFDQATARNRAALRDLLPDAEFKSFSYPISPPRPLTKARTARHYLSCRGSGQAFNSGIADLNQLSAFFLEKSRGHLENVRKMIDSNAAARGWLILATHDIAERPSPYGCTPRFFEEVVGYAVTSGSRILPVAESVEVLRGFAGTSGLTKS